MVIEGEPSQQFMSGRGLCQGDPLSLLLFNLVLENLSHKLHDAEERGSIDTYLQGVVKPITHLCFC